MSEYLAIGVNCGQVFFHVSIAFKTVLFMFSLRALEPLQSEQCLWSNCHWAIQCQAPAQLLALDTQVPVVGMLGQSLGKEFESKTSFQYF